KVRCTHVRANTLVWKYLSSNNSVKWKRSWPNIKRSLPSRPFRLPCYKTLSKKKALGPAEKRELVGYAREDFGMSLRQVCAVFNISTSVFYYRAKRTDDTEVIEQLSKLASLHRTWGFWMMYHRRSE